MGHPIENIHMGKPTVAILGASGVGKHHAKWFHLAGCDVVGFAGTSSESCNMTAAVLKDIFPFEGQPYTDVESMLDELQPHMVSVCTPSYIHGPHVIRSLEAGCQVLCEKPLLWEASQSVDELLAEGDSMLAGRVEGQTLAVNLQFAAGVAPYRKVYREATGAELGAIREFSMHWTPRPGATERAPEWYWNDLGPHALSILLGLAPDARLIPDSIDCQIFKEGTETRFFLKTEGGDCSVRIDLTAPVEGQMVREFGANGLVVGYSSEPDASGQFRSFLTLDEKKWDFEDFMKRSIERFIGSAARSDGDPFVSGVQGLHNLRMQLQIFNAARRMD